LQYYTHAVISFLDALEKDTLAPTATVAPTDPTAIPIAPEPAAGAITECVSHAELIAINTASIYWPACDPSQTAKATATNLNAPASGYAFGDYCNATWSGELNVMFGALGLSGDEHCPVRQKFLAQLAYETGYFSTLGQPLDDGSGMVHMIPQNFARNVADMEAVFPGEGLQAAYDALGTDAERRHFFKEPQHAWKSAAAWFKRTNGVIPGCGTDLFAEDYDTMTECILGRWVAIMGGEVNSTSSCIVISDSPYKNKHGGGGVK
jgi:hypothetical protein